MGVQETLQRLADRKSREIAELENQASEVQHQLDMARSYLQAIQDSMKAIPKDVTTQANGEESSIASDLRAGSLLAKTRDAIQKSGKPMHIGAILEAIGVENTKNARVSLVGSLGSYVRKGLIFNRPAPNTFGLLGMKTIETGTPSTTESLPETFGKLGEVA